MHDYDIVLFGAAGFTGRLAAEYLACHAQTGAIRWAMVGTDRKRLEAMRAAIGEPAQKVDVLVADSRDQASVDAVVSRAGVVASTAGPFARYGSSVVDACVRFRAHHANITGETWWARDLIARHHERAAAEGTRIVPFCGFDSVPSDIGALLIERHVRENFGVGCSEVRAYFQMAGGFNGGTIASLLNGLDSGAISTSDAFLLDPPGSHSRAQVARSRDVTMPRYDAEIGAWTGAFFMAPVNTRVVRRSAALSAQWNEPYGPDFVYNEYLKYSPPLALLKAAAVTAGLGVFDAAIRWAPTRQLLESILPKPGAGPSRKVMDRGWFSCDLLGLTADGRRVNGRIHHQGDPGNRSTVKMLCESALALALDVNALPGGPSRGGVLTPATALGDVLAERLRAAGVSIEIGR